MPYSSVYRVLFFIPGMSPTSEQRSEALNFGAHVSFRNAQHINDEEPCEPCVAVYGPSVPKQYAAKYPWACSIVDYYAGKLDPVAMAVPEVEDSPVPETGAGTPDFDPFGSTGFAPRTGTDWTPQG